MLIGRTKHILYIKIQASSDNNRIGFFKKRRRKKKTNILVMCYGVSIAFVCMFTQLKSVYIVIKLIGYYNYQCQLLARWLL